MDNSESLEKLYAESLKNDNTFMIETTVVTGFEWEAYDECKEKFGKDMQAIKRRGRLYFNIDWDQFAKVQEMRSIDNIFIIGDMITFDTFENNKEADLQKIKDHVHKSVHLEKAMNAWKSATNFLGKIYPTIEEHAAEKEKALATKVEELKMSKEKDPLDWDCSELETPKGKKRGQDPSESKEDDVLRYRVTCERSGKHAFESKDVAMVIGGELQDKYHWMVDLSMYHLEVVCKLTDGELLMHLRVTHESKHCRNIVNFGPTTLRSTICYSMLRLANPKLGDIVVDPMCGSGSIPIEAALAFSHCYVLCGDNHPKAVEKTKSNMDVSTTGCKIDLVQWTAATLPFKNSFIDIIVTDMPFGKRSGNKTYNKILYKKFLMELGRVVKITSGQLVLLTYDRTSFKEALQIVGKLFWVSKTVGVNVGGLHAVVYVMNRTNLLYERFKPSTAKQYNFPKKEKNSSTKLGASNKT
nr:PREDICTED: THUMP domain-containing protein 3-like [Linepithema humile]